MGRLSIELPSCLFCRACGAVHINMRNRGEFRQKRCATLFVNDIKAFVPISLSLAVQPRQKDVLHLIVYTLATPMFLVGGRTLPPPRFPLPFPVPIFPSHFPFPRSQCYMGCTTRFCLCNFLLPSQRDNTAPVLTGRTPANIEPAEQAFKLLSSTGFTQHSTLRYSSIRCSVRFHRVTEYSILG